MTALICKTIDIGTDDGFRRYVTIIRGAGKPTVHHPEKYVRACLRKLPTKSKRNSMHAEKPDPEHQLLYHASTKELKVGQKLPYSPRPFKLVSNPIDRDIEEFFDGYSIGNSELPLTFE